jgi:hypothetical protein
MWTKARLEWLWCNAGVKVPKKRATLSQLDHNAVDSIGAVYGIIGDADG